MHNFSSTVYSLWSREIVRFYRQPSRVVGALASPLLFWLLIGFGIGNSFRAGAAADNSSYLEYFFPGTLLLILLFTSIFSTISLIEDRREGFLQSVLVAPVSRTSIVLGKVLGGASLAFLQGTLFLAVVPFMGLRFSLPQFAGMLVILFINSFCMTLLGFLFAWRMNSVQGFHAIMNLILMPLWLLSGALFPAEDSPAWLALAIRMNPLSYGLAALRRALYRDAVLLESVPPLIPSIVVLCLFSAVLFAAAVIAASKRRVKDLPA